MEAEPYVEVHLTPTIPDAVRRAALLIRGAKVGHSVNFKHDDKSVYLYLLYYNSYLILATKVVIFALHLNCFIERPSIYQLKCPYQTALLLESFYMAFLVLRFVNYWSFSDRRLFWRDKKNVSQVIVFVLIVADIICYSVWTHLQGIDQAHRFSRVLRPLLIVNLAEMHNIRCSFRTIGRTLLKIMPIFAFMLFFLLFFALLGVQLFKRRQLVYFDESPYFQSILDAAWDLFVLLTTANNPDIVQPAYDSNNAFFFFFFAFMIMNHFLLMNILFASIFNEYKLNLCDEVQHSMDLRRILLTEAFNLIAECVHNRLVVTRERWCQVIKTGFPQFSTERQHFMFDILCNREECICIEDFLRVGNLLNMSIKEYHLSPTFWETYIPSFYNSWLSVCIRNFVRHRAFGWAFNIMIILQVVCIYLNINNLEWYFLIVFSIEIFLKIYAFGCRRFFQVNSNLFDAVIIGSAVVIAIIVNNLKTKSTHMDSFDILLILRVLRILKIISRVPAFKVIMTTLINLTTSIRVYAAIMFVVFYVYAIIGIEMFQGIYSAGETNCGNEKLNDTKFSNLNYCGINYNNAGNAFVLLFHMLIVNQWHVITDGIVSVTSVWTRLYFFSFIVVFRFVILNIVLAFIMDAFLLEYRTIDKKDINEIKRKVQTLGSTNNGNRNNRRPVHYQCVTHQFQNVQIGAPPSSQSDVESQVTNDGLRNEWRPCNVFFQVQSTKTKNVGSLMLYMFQDSMSREYRRGNVEDEP